jgi:hypothetical protein
VGSDAGAYANEHLRAKFEELAADVALAQCELTGRRWLRVALGVDHADPPILLQVVMPKAPDRVGVYL